MSHLAAMFLMYVDTETAFTCVTNLLASHFFVSLFRMELEVLVKYFGVCFFIFLDIFCCYCSCFYFILFYFILFYLFFHFSFPLGLRKTLRHQPSRTLQTLQNLKYHCRTISFGLVLHYFYSSRAVIYCLSTLGFICDGGLGCWWW